MNKPLVSPPAQFLLFSLVFIASCLGQSRTESSKDSITRQVESKMLPDILTLYEQQYQNMVGKWASASSRKEVFGTLELFTDNNYLLTENGDENRGKWRIVDVHHLSLGDVTYRFFFKGNNLVLVEQEGKKYELSKQNAERSDIQSILDSDTLISPFVRRIFQDKSGNLWFGTQGDGAARYDGDTLEYFSVDEGFGGVVVRGIVEDAAGNIWFGTERGITKYDGTSFTNFTEKEGLASGAIQCTFEDREGRLWLGGWMGLFRYDGKSFFSVTKYGPWQ